MWHTKFFKPESSKRIIALFDDGSGATIMWVHDHGLIDSDGEDRTWEGVCKIHALWAYLPDDFKMYCEAEGSEVDHFVMLE